MKQNSSIWKNILLLAVGVACLYYGYTMASADSSKWPTTTGQVASADITVQNPNEPAEREYYVDVIYIYTVNGVEHKTTIHTRFVSESDAKKHQSEYAPGKEPTVYYNPEDPDTSTLAPGEYKSNGYIGLVTGVVLIGMGGWGLRSRSINSEIPD
jgi:maltose-binding protein MalE